MRKDNLTVELPGLPGRPGRPPTGKAKSGADRQAAYRAKKRAEGFAPTTVVLSAEVLDALNGYVARQNADRADDQVTLGDAVDRILKAYLLRKR